MGENPYPRLNLHWLVKLQWLAAASDRLRVAEPPRFRHACRGAPGSTSGDLPAARRTASLRLAALIRDGEVVVGLPPRRDSEVESRPNCRCHGDVPLSRLQIARRTTRPLHTVPLQCHANNVHTNTYDPRRPGATLSLLSCRPNRSRSAPRQSYDKRAAPHVHFHSDDHNINVRRRLAARAKVTLVAAIEG